MVTYFCIRHKEYRADFTKCNDGSRLFPGCPNCQKVHEAGLCVDCENHQATVTFAAGAMDVVHGMTENLCRCCYFKRVEKAYTEVSANYAKIKAELEATPCAEAQVKG